MLGIQRQRFVLRTFFGQHPKLGCFPVQDGEDRVLDLQRSSGGDVAVDLPAHVFGLAQARQSDLAACPRCAHGDFKGFGIGHARIIVGDDDEQRRGPHSGRTRD